MKPLKLKFLLASTGLAAIILLSTAAKASAVDLSGAWTFENTVNCRSDDVEGHILASIQTGTEKATPFRIRQTNDKVTSIDAHGTWRRGTLDGSQLFFIEKDALRGVTCVETTTGTVHSANTLSLSASLTCEGPGGEATIVCDYRLKRSGTEGTTP